MREKPSNHVDYLFPDDYMRVVLKLFVSLRREILETVREFENEWDILHGSLWKYRRES